MISNWALLQHLLEQRQDLSSTERLVAVAIGMHRNSKTGVCDPSHERIVEVTGLSRRTVMDTIRKLKAKNVLRLEADPGKRAQSIFIFDKEEGEELGWEYR